MKWRLAMRDGFHIIQYKEGALSFWEDVARSGRLDPHITAGFKTKEKARTEMDKLIKRYGGYSIN